MFLKYQNKISWSGFEKIWLGTSCPQIGKDLLEKFKNKTRQEYSQEANIGTKNGQAKLTAEQVIQIRYLFEHRNTAKSDRQTILMLSQQYNLSASAIYSIVHYKSYKNIKPVSTIPYVEMQGSSATIDT